MTTYQPNYLFNIAFEYLYINIFYEIVLNSQSYVEISSLNLSSFFQNFLSE